MSKTSKSSSSGGGKRMFIPCPDDGYENLKCWLVASSSSYDMIKTDQNDDVLSAFPCNPIRLPTLIDGDKMIFGANAICRHICLRSAQSASSSSSYKETSSHINVTVDNVLEIVEGPLSHCIAVLSKAGYSKNIIDLDAIGNSKNDNIVAAYKKLVGILAELENNKTALDSKLCNCVLYPIIEQHIVQIIDIAKPYPSLNKLVTDVKNDLTYGSSYLNAFEGTLFHSLETYDWDSAGLFTSLSFVFQIAIKKSLSSYSVPFEVQLARCGNAAHGDFQCNNAMGLSKAFKLLDGYTGPKSPKEIAEDIIKYIPPNPLVESVTVAPNGFINVTLSSKFIVKNINQIFSKGLESPKVDKSNVLVDFSSPNIAKEMHVGHLRSTIIGDTICRILEFCGQDVMRVNHVGDWGTQFGMLITHLYAKYPNILQVQPNITDLTKEYKEAKLRFDVDEAFKETSRLNVVKLQTGDAACRSIWNLLCDISRKEFQNIYDVLGVVLTECGESFYNPYIPDAIAKLEKAGIVYEENGMKLIMLPHFTIPLILRKSDGGYGYDSTDMAALYYRINTLKRDWIIYITDAGQASHFHMCFDAGKAAGWISNKQRLDHIGFGVVCGEDGKRFKTRSSETVRLIDLLNESRDRMAAALEARHKEGKTALQGEALTNAASIIGYGAVKYFDLKQNPTTNYIFNYDRMLDTKGDTAVYLLFAYARVASILNKAADEKGIPMVTLQSAENAGILVLGHPAERALAFELLQFGDVIKRILRELSPHLLCDYLKELCVKFTDFVTKCIVLHNEDVNVTHSRLILCEATRKAMYSCINLLGIKCLDRI